MKRFSKLTFVAVLAIVLGCLASCKPAVKVVSSWKEASSMSMPGYSYSSTLTLIFYDDNSCVYSSTAEINGEKLSMTMNGTYTGDANTDGELEITVKKVKYEIPDSLKDMYGDTSDAYAEGQKIPAVIAGDEITVFGALKMKRQ